MGGNFGCGDMTLGYHEVQERLSVVGIVLSKRGDRLRVNFFGGLEDTAGYAESLQEALDLGTQMARPEKRPTQWLSARPDKSKLCKG